MSSNDPLKTTNVELKKYKTALDRSNNPPTSHKKEKNSIATVRLQKITPTKVDIVPSKKTSSSKKKNKAAPSSTSFNYPKYYLDTIGLRLYLSLNEADPNNSISIVSSGIRSHFIEAYNLKEQTASKPFFLNSLSSLSASCDSH